jgi:transcriptional regulator with XRE-family HTH domain
MSETKSYPALFLLGHALRELRAERDISLRTMARQLAVAPAVLSSWELGIRRPPAEALGFILGFLQVKPPTYRKLLLIHQQGDRPSCVEDAAGKTPSLEGAYELHAVRKFEWVPHLVPKLLRTPEQIQTELQNRGVASDDIDQAIFAQHAREVDRPKHFPSVILVSEAAWASSADLPQLKNVTVGIVPTSSCRSATVEAFTIYETEAGMAIVVLRNEHARIYLGDPATVKSYRTTFAQLQRQASQ